jgi:heptose-I-phosphate ethanolaminephosphotransferase
VSYLLYLPDHGEDAIDDDSSFDHGTSNARDNMFEIPFIVWTSPEYKRLRRKFLDGIDVSRAFNTQHLIHAVMDLSGLAHPDIDLKKSPFSKSYGEPAVLIVR